MMVIPLPDAETDHADLSSALGLGSYLSPFGSLACRWDTLNRSLSSSQSSAGGRNDHTGSGLKAAPGHLYRCCTLSSGRSWD